MSEKRPPWIFRDDNAASVIAGWLAFVGAVFLGAIVIQAIFGFHPNHPFG